MTFTKGCNGDSTDRKLQVLQSLTTRISIVLGVEKSINRKKKQLKRKKGKS